MYVCAVSEHSRSVVVFGGKGVKVFNSEALDVMVFDAGEKEDWVMDANIMVSSLLSSITISNPTLSYFTLSSQKVYLV